MNWNKVTVAGYVEYYKSLDWKEPKDAIQQLDQNIERLSYLTGISYEEIEEMSITQVTEELKQARENMPQVLYESFEFKGRYYVVDKDPTKYNAGRYMSVMNACTGNTIENLHRILFNVCREVDKKGNTVKIPDEELMNRMDEFKELPMLYANPIAVFFWNLSKDLTNVTLQYLDDQVQKANQALQTEITYLQDSAG